VLLSANPSALASDPETADVTYIEPLTPGALKKFSRHSGRTR
jgi:carbamoylphosphate synthase large subunit